MKIWELIFGPLLAISAQMAAFSSTPRVANAGIARAGLGKNLKSGLIMRCAATLLSLLLGWSGGAGAQEGLSPTTLLEDAREQWVKADGHFRTTDKLRIRINDARALETSGVQTLAFNARFSEIQVLQAYVQRPNGRRRFVRKTGISIVAKDKAGAEQVHRDLRLLRVTFLDLKVDDEIYLKTLTVSKGRLPFPKQFVETFIAVGPIVDKATSLTIDAPVALPLYFHQRGFSSAEPVKARGRIRYRWNGDGSHNARIEQDAADAFSFRSVLVVTSFADAAALGRALDPHYRKQSQPNAEVAQLTSRVVAGAGDAREKALAIRRWVQEHIRYQAIYQGNATWIPSNSAAQILHARVGDCKDHVVLMAAMLAAAGIESSPALIDWGQDLYTLPPVVHQGSFNHAITFLPTLNLYLDAASKATDGGYLPPDQLDKVTLLTRTGEIGRTPAHQVDRRLIQYTVAIAADRSAQFSHAVRAEGYRAGQLRHQFSGHTRNAPGSWVNTLLQQRSLSGQGTEDFGNLNKDAQSYSYTYRERIDQFFSPPPTLDFTASGSLSDDIGSLASLMLTERTRTQPFVCNAVDIEEQATYTWPGKFDLEGMPADVEILNPIVHYVARYRRNGNSLSIDRNLRFAKTGAAVCAAADFDVVGPAMLSIKNDTQYRIRLEPAAVPEAQITMLRPGDG
jgi:transglutaminase-like putative cysteine protease